MKKMKDWGYNAVYFAIALSMFKHSAWSIGVVIEGTPPVLDFATMSVATMQDTVNLVFMFGEWFFWYFFGALMAFAFDVLMFVISKDIQQKDSQHVFGKWIAFSIAAFGSALLQFYYAANNGAPATPNENLLPVIYTGWLRTVLDHSTIIVPLLLPTTATILTIFLRNESMQEIKHLTKSQKLLDVTEAKQYLGVKHNKDITEAAIRHHARENPNFATKIGRKWFFEPDNLDEYIKHSH
jgi:hypothetical protein